MVKKQIVKVQLSLSTTESVPQMLIYNEDRSIYIQGDAVKSFIEELKDYPKAYFWARVKKGILHTYERAPEQSW